MDFTLFRTSAAPSSEAAARARALHPHCRGRNRGSTVLALLSVTQPHPVESPSLPSAGLLSVSGSLACPSSALTSVRVVPADELMRCEVVAERDGGVGDDGWSPTGSVWAGPGRGWGHLLLVQVLQSWRSLSRSWAREQPSAACGAGAWPQSLLEHQAVGP